MINNQRSQEPQRGARTFSRPLRGKKIIRFGIGILFVLTLFAGVSAFSYDEDEEGNPFYEADAEIKVPSISIKNLFILEPSSEPANPELGMIYFDVSSKRLKLYDGTGWHSIALEKVSSVSKQQVKETIEKKGEVQDCSSSTECDDWGDCINNYQSMTCITIDEGCNKYEDSETRDCIVENPFQEEIEEAEEDEQVEEEEVEDVGEVEEEEEVEEEAPAESPRDDSGEPESIPEELFDITFDLEENSLSSSDKLVVWITLQNFGRRYVPARLIYIVTDEQSEEVYRNFEEVRVYSDESLIKTFSDLDLEKGKYNLMLEVEYAGIVEDFELGFSVETGFWAGIKRFFGGLF